MVYITVRGTVVRDDDPVMPRPIAVDSHIMIDPFPGTASPHEKAVYTSYCAVHELIPGACAKP